MRGIVAPESDDNPYYKKLNQNILLAGKAVIIVRMVNRKIETQRTTAERIVEIPEIGFLSWYPNRLTKLCPHYGLEDAKTL